VASVALGALRAFSAPRAVYTSGPEVTFTGIYDPRFLMSITARYLWDVGPRAGLEGRRSILFLSAGGLFR
jgi:hypothetical protein